MEAEADKVHLTISISLLAEIKLSNGFAALPLKLMHTKSRISKESVPTSWTIGLHKMHKYYHYYFRLHFFNYDVPTKTAQQQLIEKDTAEVQKYSFKCHHDFYSDLQGSVISSLQSLRCPRVKFISNKFATYMFCYIHVPTLVEC